MLFAHRIGALLLKGEWKAAVDMIMGRLEGERSENDEARRLFLEEGDISGALKLMQRYLTAERALLEVSHLRSHAEKPSDSLPDYAHIGNDLCQMPRKLVTRCSPLRVIHL